LEEESQKIKDYSPEFCHYDELGSRLTRADQISTILKKIYNEVGIDPHK
jgi:hypothetical protein